MSVSLAAVCDLKMLKSCWADVLAADRADGNLGIGVSRFAEDADELLERLSQQLLAREYKPGVLHRVDILREDGTTRPLHISSVADRIVERAILTTVTPAIEPLLSSWSFAYRPGLGVADAVQTLARRRDEGLVWVARTDIEDCFPTISISRVARMVASILEDRDLLDVIRALLHRSASESGRLRPMRGLPQGSPLSPLWANLALTSLDDRLADAGYPAVRYADDLAIPARTRDEAWEAMRVAHDAVEDLDLRLNSDKSQVMSFDEGFTFLGEDFGPRYPPSLEDHRAADPPRKVLYVGIQGARVRLERGRAVVESGDDQELLDVPSGLLERVVSFGAVGISAGLRSWAFGHSVDMVFLSRRGSYLGSTVGNGHSHVPRLRAQLSAQDDPAVRLSFGRAVIEGKLRKQVVALRRFARPDTAEIGAEASHLILRLLPMLDEAESTNELLGIEGAAARAYFGAIGALMPDGLTFEGRSRRPPRDVVNAALSYGYSILTGEAVSALHAAGLDPAIGLLHADDDRRPSLALDLIEDFRPLVVDQVVLTAAKLGRLTAEHGRTEDGVDGVLLTRAGRQSVIDGYEKRMLTMTKGALPGFSGSLRRHLYRQAERISAFVHGHDDTWAGLAWR